MHPKSIVHALIAVALLGLPSAALADQDTNSGPGQHNGTRQQQENSHQQHHVNRDNRGARDNRGDRDDQRARDDQRDRDARNNANNGRYNNGGNNGRYNNGGNNGNYNNGGNNGRYNGGYNNGGYNNGGNNNGQLNGVVSAFSAFNLQLSNGQRVTLHQGTVINPNGTTLTPGMQVAIYGHNNGDGTFAADTINVLNGNGQYNQNNGVGGLSGILRNLGIGL